MQITFDPDKRQKTLAERNLDFVDAARIFAGETHFLEDTRKDYGEKRELCVGFLEKRMVIVAFVRRGDACHVFSMRKANDREQKRFLPYFRPNFRE
jgi:uncharacterized DUF497 family protein